MRCSSSSGRYYERLADGRLADPVFPGGGPPHVRMPGWLVAEPEPEEPPLSIVGLQVSGRVWEITSFADALAREGDCEQAAVEFRRAAHLIGSPEAHAWAHGRSGGCSLREGDWLGAERNLLASAMLASGADARGRALLTASACRFNLGDFAGCGRLAQASLEEQSDAVPLAGPAGDADRAVMRRAGDTRGVSRNGSAALGAMGLSLLARGEWSAASERFRRASLASDDSRTADRLRFLAARAPAGVRLPRRSPGLALAFSTALPGAGQAYSGRLNEGLRYLIMNGALGFTVAQLVRDRKYAGAYVVAGLGLPFYLGNLHGARTAAREFNRSRRMEFVQAAVDEAAQ